MTLTIELDDEALRLLGKMGMSANENERSAASWQLGQRVYGVVTMMLLMGELTPEQCTALGLEAR